MTKDVLELTKGHSTAFDALLRVIKDEEAPVYLRPLRLNGTGKRRINDKFKLRGINWCHWCKGKLNEIQNHPRCQSLDHVIPRRFGGPNGFFNIVLSCRTCDNERGSVNDKEEILAYYGVSEEELRKYL